MKILVVTQYFYPETFRVNILCRELARRGHDVTVLTGYPQYPQGRIYEGYGFHTPYDPEWNGVRVVRLPVQPRGRTPLGLLRNCASFVRQGEKWVRRCRERFDAVYVFEVSPVTVGLPAVAYKEKFSVPLYFNVQDLWPENVEVVLGVHNRLVLAAIDRIVDRIYGASDVILCASRGFAEHIAARGVPREKLVFWPQFCDRPDTTGGERPPEYAGDAFNIIFAGNIGDAQGLDLLVDAAQRLKDGTVRWFLAGDGRARAALEERVRVLGLEERVTFLGRLSEAEADRYVRFADCAYLSFRDNAVFDMTIPAKLQTYLACGTPILAAAGGESAALLREYGCGVVTEKTPSAVCAGAEELRSLPPEEREAMGRRAAQCCGDLFDRDRLIGQLEELMAAGAASAPRAPEA